MKFVFIINPKAGGAAAARRRRRLLAVLEESSLTYEVKRTDRRRHAVELARAAAAEGCAVVAIGGDGTAHEVATGIIESGYRAPFAVLPMGTGNDFAKMLDVPRSLETAVGTLAREQVQAIDFGTMEWDGPDGQGRGYFINIGGTGFDAKVAAAAPAFKYLTGTPRYIASVLRTLGGWDAPRARVALQAAGSDLGAFDGQLLLALAGNGVCSGGGFYLTPDASIVDGRLDACVIRDASIPRILTLIPRALNGRHVGAPEVKIEKVDRMVVETSEPLPVQADGEILAQRATRVNVEIVQGGLDVLIPVKR